MYNLIMKIFTKKKIIVFLFFLVLFFILNLFNFKSLFYSVSEKIQTTLWDKNSEISLSKVDTKNLIEENQRLNSLLSVLEETKRENEFLKNSLGLKNYDDAELIPGRIISKDYLSDSILINIGSKDGAKKGFPVVISENILLGKVSEVYSNYSRVQLLSLKDNLTDVNVDGISALAKGNGKRGIDLEMFPRDKDLGENEFILTSFLGGNYPAGLVVGKVVNVRKIDNEPFQSSDIDLIYDLFLIDRVFMMKVTQIFND